MINLLFIIRSLESGGAETQLFELVKNINKSLFNVTVITFYDGGEIYKKIERLKDVKVVSLQKKGRWDTLPFLWRLWDLIRALQPDILHGYMGIANELSLLASKLLGAKALWGLRASNVEFESYGKLARLFFRIGAVLSKYPDLIIVNSEAGRQHHIARGYCPEQMLVIHNGIDSERFAPDAKIGEQLRAEWGVQKGEKLVGLAARLDPMKDHPTFLHAAAILMRTRSDLRFVCVGDGAMAYKKKLHSLAQELGLDQKLIWVGWRGDMPAVYNALDIATSSSAFGEGFSNGVGEAMACGTPCVVTNVGDSAMIVDQTGVVVRPKNPDALAEAWTRILNLSDIEQATLGIKARKRIEQEFTLSRLTTKTEEALMNLID